MKNKKIFIVFVLLILVAIVIGIYQYYSSHLFNQDGTISDGYQDLINHLQEIEDAEERENQIDFALEQNLITQEEAAQLRNKRQINSTNVNNRTIEKVSMKIKEGTLTKTSATIIIHDENEEPYMYGRWFRIDRKENGEWKEVEFTNPEGAIFTEEAIAVGEDKNLEMEVDWSSFYGELGEGEYRLVKELGENGDYDVEFRID